MEGVKKECNKCQKTDVDFFKCACGNVFYCGRDCQKADWKEHKPVCNYKPETKPKIEEAPQQKEKAEAPSKAENYTKIRKAGDGNFSEIWLVEKKDTKEQYALKIINIQRLRQLHKENDVVMEVHCLNRLADCENVINLHERFKDELSLYLVMEYVPGGELWDRLRSFGFIAESLLKYFFAHLVKAVEVIHSRGIVHRDLKPENVMLDLNNKIKLIDFGTARDLEHPEVKGAGNSARGKRIFEHFVGTPHYMAPECVRNRDSNKKSDVWSLGCILYQFIAGYPPYLGGSDYLIFQKSQEKAAIFDSFLFGPEARELIELTLERDFEKRISLDDVKKHAYFKDVDFENIISYEEAVKKISPFEEFLIGVKEKLSNLNGNEEESINNIINQSKESLKQRTDFDEELQVKGQKWLGLLERQARAHWHLEDFDWHA